MNGRVLQRMHAVEPSNCFADLAFSCELNQAVANCADVYRGSRGPRSSLRAALRSSFNDPDQA